VAPALFVTRDYKINRRIVQSVEQWQYHAAGIAEHGIHTLFDERIDDDLGACFNGGFAGCTSRGTRLGLHFSIPFLTNVIFGCLLPISKIGTLIVIPAESRFAGTVNYGFLGSSGEPIVSSQENDRINRRF
jgi:hypothetical protein